MKKCKMKIIIILNVLISTIWSQCDANNDGNIDVIDILIQIDCILEDIPERPPAWGILPQVLNDLNKI